MLHVYTTQTKLHDKVAFMSNDLGKILRDHGRAITGASTLLEALRQPVETANRLR